MLAADAAAPKIIRRPHDPASPCLVPAIAAGHRDPIVRELVTTLERLYERRGVLRHPLLNRVGDQLFPAFPELLQRPPAHQPECPHRRSPAQRPGSCPCPPRGPDLPRRRSDGMEAVIRVLLVLAACCDWRTMRLMDPAGGYLSVWRIAELAELPVHLVAPNDDQDPRRRRFRMDAVERVLRNLRTARILVFTQQHREQLPDGRHTSTAPAIRKLSVGFFEKFGGVLAEIFRRRRKHIKRRAENRERDLAAVGVGVDLRSREELRKLPMPGAALKPNVQENAPSPAHGNPDWWSLDVPGQLIDAVHAEHPDWPYSRILAEARQRLAAEQPALPTSSSSEPPGSS